MRWQQRKHSVTGIWAEQGVLQGLLWHSLGQDGAALAFLAGTSSLYTVSDPGMAADVSVCTRLPSGPRAASSSYRILFMDS